MQIDQLCHAYLATCLRSAGQWLFAAISVVALAACEKPATESDAQAIAAGPATASYIGGSECAVCHADALKAWTGSHHDLAMQAAAETTVLGDFGNESFEHDGTTSEFLLRDGEYRVKTLVGRGETAELAVTHAFGIEPLQQYLVERPRGHYQTLTMAWDTRPASEGGQRWFDLHPDEDIPPADPLHWTGLFQSWNTSCAGCHSTNLEKNYEPQSDSFNTTYSSIDVDCEACHGPGSLHADDPANWPMKLASEPEAEWVFEPGSSIAKRVPERTQHEQVETCAQCHSRRSQLVDRFEPGTPLMHGFRPELLEEGLYYADGQILDEVFVYGSFVQSKMFAAGVTCTDCHEPHSNRLRADGNAVCAQCHLASTYETPEHHRHEAGGPGAQCVDCHMPAKTYMVVDPRRDHSFRVPRPDIAATIDAPDACSGCHDDRDAAWAAAIVKEWHPDGRSGTPHYGEAIAAARNWQRDWPTELLGVVGDMQQPAIVRATAVRLLSRQPNAEAIDALRAAFDDDPLVQLAAVDTLAAMPEQQRLELGLPLLSHPLLAVRVAAARQLAAAGAQLPQSRRTALDAALAEYREVQAFHKDRPEGWVNLAGLDIELGETGRAEAALETAIERFPWFTPGYVALADLYRRSGRDSAAMPLLEKAVDANPEDPAGWLALGLARIRAGTSEDAIASFRKAVELAPGEPYYRYVLGVALNSTAPGQAIDYLAGAYESFPGYRDIPFALATMNRDAGDTDAALEYARQLLEITGPVPGVLGLVNQLEAEQGKSD